MPADVAIYYTNDQHGVQSALDRLEQARAGENDLVVDAGDAILGSNTAFRRHEPILARMGRLGYAAMTMGNREFHYLRFVHRWREAERGFPILAANLEDLRATDRWQPTLRVERNGVRIGLVGATPVQYPVGAFWEKLFGFRFLPPEACLPEYVEELRSQCDVVIFLSHLGYDRDLEIAPRLPGVDLILGGHTHTVLAEPDRRGPIPICQTGSHGRYLGKLKLWVGSPMRLEYQLIA